MTEPEFDAFVDAYLLEVRRRLKIGWQEWRDRASAFSMDRIMSEIAEEGADVAGWGFWAWLAAQKAKPNGFTPPPR
jgi:hypothetical protein